MSCYRLRFNIINESFIIPLSLIIYYFRFITRYHNTKRAYGSLGPRACTASPSQPTTPYSTTSRYLHRLRHLRAGEARAPRLYEEATWRARALESQKNIVNT